MSDNAEREYSAEIWSEFFRAKNRLMDYDENFQESIAVIRMLMKHGANYRKLQDHYAKAHRHVVLIYDLGLKTGAINPKDTEEQAVIEKICRGEWKDITDFEKAQVIFRKWFTETKLYNVTVQQDNRPAVVKKYGKSSRYVE